MASGFRLQASGFRLQASGFRLQASGWLQASGFNGEFTIDVTSSEIPNAFIRDEVEKLIF
jgi:hypothetical protein